jgi:hypothetical protein
MGLLASFGLQVKRRGELVQSLTGPPRQGFKRDRSISVLLCAISHLGIGFQIAQLRDNPLQPSQSSVTGNCFSNFALLASSNAALCFSDIGFFFLASASFARLRSHHALKPSSVFDLKSSAAFQQRSQIPLMFFVCRPQCHLQVLIVVYASG